MLIVIDENIRMDRQMFFRWLFRSFLVLPICSVSPAVAQIADCFRTLKNVKGAAVLERDRKMLLIRTTVPRAPEN